MEHWWDVLVSTAWLLLWPFGKEGGEKGQRPLFVAFNEMVDAEAQTYHNIVKGDYSRATDSFLHAVQLANTIVGMFSGWILAGLALGGFIAGLFTAGAGLGAGLALAAEVGEGLLVIAAATEGAILLKSVYNLEHSGWNADREDDYERIAGSGLSLAIMGVLFILGAAAAKYGKAIVAAAGRALIGLTRAIFGPAAAAFLEAAFGRIRAAIAAIVLKLQKLGKFKLNSSGVTAASYEGPALRLHPERFDEIIADLERNGVDVNVFDRGDPWTGSYGPGGEGKPGRLSVHREVDLRTLEHEYQHFLDDKARGFPGLRFYVENPGEMFAMEESAYNREIELVNLEESLSPEDKAAIIKELKDQLEVERARYGQPTPQRQFSTTNSQLGTKVGEHAKDFGLDPGSAADRQQLIDLINDIGRNPDRTVTGTFRGQGPGGTRGPVEFRIKGDDVVVTKPDGEFVTILKDGINNSSVVEALKAAGQ